MGQHLKHATIHFYARCNTMCSHQLQQRTLIISIAGTGKHVRNLGYQAKEMARPAPLADG